MKTIKPAATLFTDRVDDQTAMIVRRIAGKHESFATDFIGVTDADGTIQVAVRLEAWRAPDGSWAIDRLTYAGAVDRVSKAIEARPGLCFFDALSHCALFQVTELNGHDERHIVSVPGYESRDIVSVREAAAAAHQVIDDEGYAVPCAAGRILLNGSFSPATLAVAAQTRHDPAALVPADASSFPAAMRDLLAVNLPAVPDGDDIARYSLKRTREGEKKAEIEKLENAGLAGQELLDCIASLTQQEFKTNGSVKKAVLTLGIAPLIGYMAGDRRFPRAKAHFLKAAQALTDPGERSLVAAFADAAESAFLLERANHGIRQDRMADRHSNDAVRKAMADVERAGTLAGMPALDIRRLRSACLDQGFDPLFFAGQLRKSWIACELALQKDIARLEGGDVPPDIERIGQVMPDGTVYAGISPSTRRLMFAAPEDVRLERSWLKTIANIASLRDFHGHNGITMSSEEDLLKHGAHEKGWRLPTIDELKMLYHHKNEGALKGSFDETGRDPESWYWSISRDKDGDPRTLCMVDGRHGAIAKSHSLKESARYVLSPR